jgi:YidC/Oxa1 family membrane protein insertase
MDIKILVIALLALGGFFVFKQCSEDDATFDQKVQQERTAKTHALEAKKATEARVEKEKAIDDARKERGARAKEELVTFDTKEFTAVFTTRRGSLKRFTLKNPQYLEAPRDWKNGRRDEETDKLAPVDLVTTNTADYDAYNPLQFEVYKGLKGLLPDADYKIVEHTDTKIVFKYTQKGIPVAIFKKFEIVPESSPFQVWTTVRVTNISNEKVTFRAGLSQHGYQHQTEAAGGLFSKQPNLLRGYCRHGDDTFATAWNDDDLAHPFSAVGEISYVGVGTNYFLDAMMPTKDTPATCHVSAEVRHAGDKEHAWGRIVAELRFAEATLAPGESQIYKVKNYLGPKRYRLLQSVGHHLETAVDFGMLWPICQVLLSILFFFQSYVLNWGVAIILLTVVVKVVLMPLTHKSFQSAERMKALKPLVDKINEQFKDDPQAKQRETMALYKQHKVNPLGGCIPSVLQMPIWFALFRTLRASPELYRAPFFGWITDLSNPDPYFVTPLIMGVAMFLQQRMTPMTGDSQQAKMMLYFMPVMFTAMMLFLPSGLTLYILVNTVLSIAHQFYIHRRSGQRQGPSNRERGDSRRRSKKGQP